MAAKCPLKELSTSTSLVFIKVYLYVNVIFLIYLTSLSKINLNEKRLYSVFYSFHHFLITIRDTALAEKRSRISIFYHKRTWRLTDKEDLRMINLTDDSRLPVAEPIALEGEHLVRYLEIRALRLLFDQSGHRPVGWAMDGQVIPGQWKMRPHKERVVKKI